MSTRDEHIKRIVEAAQRDNESSGGTPMRVRRTASSASNSKAQRPKSSATLGRKANNPYPTQVSQPPKRKRSTSAIAAPAPRKRADTVLQDKGTIQEKLSKSAAQTLENDEPTEKKHFVWAGMAFIFLAGFLLLSTLSYFKYWKVDQNIAFWSELFSGSAQNTMNWCGRLGAIISQDIIGRWFGIFGVLTAPIAAISALKLFRIEGLRLHKWLRSTLLIMFTGSVVCGHFFGINGEVFGSGWGGEMGIYSAQWLQAIIGNEGTSLLLSITALAILYYVNAQFIRDIYRKTRKFMEEMARKRRLAQAAAQLRDIEMAQRLAQHKAALRAQQLATVPTPINPALVAATAPQALAGSVVTPEVPITTSETSIEPTKTEQSPITESTIEQTATEISSESTETTTDIPKVETPKKEFQLIELEGSQYGVVTGYEQNDGAAQFLYMDRAALPLVAQPIASTTPITATNGKQEDNEPDEDEMTMTLEQIPAAQAPLQSSISTTDKIIPTQKESANSTTLAPDFVAHRPVEEAQIVIEDIEDEAEIDDMAINNMELYDPTLELRSYKKPPIELLKDHSLNVTVTDEELMDNKNRIVHTLETFGIRIDSIEVVVGPTITLYEIVPAPGIRISKIKNLEDDIAMALSALGIRIIAPIPGKGTIGIEVPNKEKNIVSMYSVIKSARFQDSKADLPIAIGKTIQNETFVLDLAKMPHLLVAGATGQGKSVGLNAIITSLIYKKHPSELKFILVDPKKVELTLYAKLENHFLAKIPDADEAIITDNQKVIYTLNSICIEMENRYTLLKEARVRGIKEYNDKFTHRRLNPEKGHRYLPYFVVIIDEFADLIMTSGREIETPIARIAQLARAVGIHLIIATQRPTTNIITGVIKANFPARVAFRVTSQIDSRTILDQSGANQLVGQGDMLISTGNAVTRVQCAFVDTPEVELIVDHIAEQRGYEGPYQLPDYQPESEGGSSTSREDLGKRDPLFEEVAHYVVAHQVGSASTIQRKFSIGFNRAGRIVDQLESAGIIGTAQGPSKPRQVLVSDPMTLESML